MMSGGSSLWDLNSTPPADTGVGVHSNGYGDINIKSVKPQDSHGTSSNPALTMNKSSATDLSDEICIYNYERFNSSPHFTENSKSVLSKSCSSISKLLDFSINKPRFESCITRQFFPPKNSLDSVIPSSQSQFSEAFWSDARLKLLPLPLQTKKTRRGPRSRSSEYRGVTFYRRTGRWESHIWDCGKQVYLGGFDTAHIAARTYDRAAIKFRGPEADINFNLSDYEEDLKQMTNLTKEEFVKILRRQSNGFPRGGSRYKSATLQKPGRWEARIEQFVDKRAYDWAPIKRNGKEEVTNFDPSIYWNGFNSETKNTNDEQNLNLSLSLPSTLVSCTLVSEDNKRSLLQMKSSLNTLAEHDRKKARHSNTMSQADSPNSEKFQVNYALTYGPLSLPPTRMDDNVHLTMEQPSPWKKISNLLDGVKEKPGGDSDNTSLFQVGLGLEIV
ncbi:hypothetical protein SUGI_1008300 [Cryptomeria japonica]|uniref:ethylene-responsive transcription factor RAP2-7 n=1 Tax=Cryptomeria japonica TaxID=3369 RepID=UPI00241498B3|nr:ethylene-responsive transcription factor RAP2-7 [Cryptomeria japonica]GLJ47741.1 hypothetical protein SUGI_1008300 [Cryptomeria japonica]